MNPKMRIWVGGQGKKRTPQLAARYADGFNAPYLSPEDLHSRLEALDRACDEIQRDPAEITRTVNVGFYLSDDPRAMEKRKAELAHLGTGGLLMGSTQQAVDRIGEYQRAGAEGLNIAFRPPIDWDAYQAFLEDVAPKFA